jgi:hypothetical protein
MKMYSATDRHVDWEVARRGHQELNHVRRRWPLVKADNQILRTRETDVSIWISGS